jgi:hypothetical protein
MALLRAMVLHREPALLREPVFRRTMLLHREPALRRCRDILDNRDIRPHRERVPIHTRRPDIRRQALPARMDILRRDSPG